MSPEPQQMVSIKASNIRFDFEPECGFICDLSIKDEGRQIEPMHKAPWIGDAMDEGSVPHLAKLQGDFFCAPFGNGGGDAPILHGWPANGYWEVDESSGSSLQAQLRETVQSARVTKSLRVINDHPFVYQSHRFEGGEGTISVANHAMVSLPEGGLLSFSPKRKFQTPATALELDATRGRSALAYPAQSFDSKAFPRAGGGTLDLTTYPFLERHEDFVAAVEEPTSPLGWTAVVRKGKGELFLSLRNPKALPLTMLWHSDGGRDYAPWLGRHRACLGVEEGNAPHILGGEGGVDLESNPDIRHAIGAISWPSEERVLEVLADGQHLMIIGENGHERRVNFDFSHLFPEV